MFKLMALSLAAAFWLVWLFFRLREAKCEPVRVVLDRFSRIGWLNRIALLFIVANLTMFGGAKHGGTNAPPMGMIGFYGGHALDLPGSRISEQDYDNGYVLYCVETNETFDFSVPTGAGVATNWVLRGAANDYQRIDFGNFMFPYRGLMATNAVVFADGSVRFGSGVNLPGFAGRLAVVPAANWGLLNETNRPSLFWWTFDGCESSRFTWQNALMGRNLTNVVSYQVELRQDGNFTCRSGDESYLFHRLVDEDRVNQDRDGDGLTTEEEIFDFGTDPGLTDTDGDGVSDGEEVRLLSNPLSRDTDLDNYADATDPHVLVPDGHDDADEDGLPDTWKNGWFGEDVVVSPTDDPGQDGINNLNAYLMGVNPLSSATNGFAETSASKPVNLNAWTIAPSAFSFVAPNGTSNLITRTFAVGRVSPWQHYFVSSCPNQAQGWGSADIVVEWEADGQRGVLPASSDDSFRLPIGTNEFFSTMTFRVAVTGPQPSLSRPLYLLRWTPHLGFHDASTVSVFSSDRERIAVCPDPETGAYVLPHDFILSGYPHRAGMDATVAASLELPPVEGLRRVDGVFTVNAASWFDLPPEGLDAPKRIIFYRMVISSSGDVDSGPRASQYAPPYPLDTKKLRKAYSENSEVQVSDTFTVSVLPNLPEMGYRIVREDAPPMRMLPPSGDGEMPPASVNATCDGNDCTNQPPTHVEPTPPGRDVEPEAEEETRGCSCNADGTQFGSFNIRISLGESAKDVVSGYLWASISQPTLVSASSFGILGTELVTAVTNSLGDIQITSLEDFGSTVAISNVLNGVDITVWLANGELDCIWQIRNENGDASTIRARKLTRLGNATVDETYGIRSDADERIRWEYTDNICGVSRIKRETADPAEPEFIVEESEDVYLAGNLIRQETRTYERVGEGESAVRRLSSVSGTDERGSYAESRTYYCDAAHRYRHGKLRSVRSSRQSWAYYDYDLEGREVVRIEQLDGSTFPELGDVSLTVAMPDWASAKIEVKDYAPRLGDDNNRNDIDLPRLTATYVRTNGGAPVMISRQERFCTREYDSQFLPLRRATVVDGFGAATRTTVSVSYAEDPDVPTALRGMETYTENDDGSSTSTEYTMGDGTIVATARTSFEGVERQTYTVTTYDESFGLPLRFETRLSANDVLVDWTENTYDNRQRLRSTTYADGTSETNAYSCCRLLWKRDREGRKTLRSARTGTDSLYYAEEDVWLDNVSGDGNHRVTQHFFDGLGRETNTVTYADWIEGGAADPVVPSASQHPVSRTTEYKDNWSCGESTTTDERGAVTEKWGYESEEQVERNTLTEADDMSLEESTTTYRGGRTETYRSWDDKWMRRIRSTAYSPEGNRIEMIMTESSDCGIVTNAVVVYDPLGRVVSLTTPNGTTAMAYAGATTRILTETFAAGNVTRTQTKLYDVRGEEVGEMLDGVTTRKEIDYEEVSNVWWKVTREITEASHTNALTVTREQVTGLGSGIRSRVVKEVREGEKSDVTVSFDAASGLLTETKTHSQSATVVSWSYYGLETAKETENETEYTWYDAFGRPIWQDRSDGEGWHPIAFSEYDDLGDLVGKFTYTNGWDGVEETYAYDSYGNCISKVDALGNETTFEFDAVGNLVSEDGATYPARYEYDSHGRRVAMSTNRSGDVWDETRWSYDPHTGLRTEKRRADGTTVGYTYTDDGLLETTTRANGHWTRNVYDAHRQLVGVQTDEGDTVTITRDEFGRETGGQNAAATYFCMLSDSGVATNETVTIAGQSFNLFREIDDNGRVVAFAVTSLVQRIAYAADGKVATVSNEDACVTYAYSMGGRDVGSTMILTNGTTFARTLSRDPFRRDLVTAVDNSIGADFAYAYDAASRLVRRDDDLFDYNARSEVVGEVYQQAVTNSQIINSFSYDNIGNLTFAEICGVTNAYAANAVNEYVGLTEGGVEVATTYDAEGNLTVCGDWTYSYDAENRLKTVSTNGVLVATNFYDYKGRRVRMVTQEASYTFVYDGWNVVLELVERNGTTDLVEYFWGKDISGTLQGAGGIGGLLYLRRNGTIYVPIYDASGNVVEYRAADGSLVAEYSYDAFGRTIAESGALADVFRHRHETKCYEHETGFYYYGYRHYVPSLCRWLTQDPIEEDGGLNLYGFCGNNPIDRYDALGRSWADWVYCMGNCVDKWRYDWAQMIDAALSLLTPFDLVPKDPKILAKSPKGVSKYTSLLSRKAHELILRLRVVGTAKAIKTAYAIRRAVRYLKIPTRILNWGGLTYFTIAEGMYNWVAISYCAGACCADSQGY